MRKLFHSMKSSNLANVRCLQQVYAMDCWNCRPPCAAQHASDTVTLQIIIIIIIIIITITIIWLAKARRQATSQPDADFTAAQKTVGMKCHSSAHPSRRLCKHDGSLRWCSSWTGSQLKVSQIRPPGTGRPPVSANCDRNSRPSEWVINLFFSQQSQKITLVSQDNLELSFRFSVSVYLLYYPVL